MLVTERTTITMRKIRRAVRVTRVIYLRIQEINMTVMMKMITGHLTKKEHIDIARKIVEKTDEYGIMADQQHPRVEYEEHTSDNLQDELNIVNIVKQNKIAKGPSHPEQSHQLTSQEKKNLYPRSSQVILDM
ncbi:hypothetical protein JTB14_007450 [Gonioctena quinquepunctata]|nr:hypothetical protein JTB14_007450 [Gonioctena quinquepunctata]